MIMKKVLYLLMAAAVLFTSCSKDKVGGTAVEAMAGEWYVVADQVDASGNTVAEDLFGAGRFHFCTFNTAANGTKEMWISDLGNFWTFQVKVDIDMTTMTFQTNTPQEAYEGCMVTVTNGKIELGTAVTPSGMPADYIECTISFSDDTYAAKYNYAAHKFSGYRYTGFADDEE